jgi:flagellar basal-body rod protein FlgG
MRALYTAATGMRAQQMRIDNIANNLSNVSTTGYKKAREAFEDLVYQTVPVGSSSLINQRPAALEMGTGTRIVAVQRDFSTGDLTYSGNELDLAIGGRGFFVVQDANGNQRYTRDGRFQRNLNGEMVTAAGLTLSPSIQIPQDAARVIVNEDGSVQVEYKDDTDVVTIGQIQLVEFQNPAGLRSAGGNLFMATPESGQPMFMDTDQGMVNIQQAFLESSNVDVAEELITMIVAQRSFELTSKVVETSDQMLQTVSGMKR